MGALPQPARPLPSGRVLSVAFRRPVAVVGELRVDILRDVVVSLDGFVVVVAVHFWNQM